MTLFTEAAGRTIACAGCPDEVLAAKPFLGIMTGMLDRVQPADEAAHLACR